MQQCRGRQRSHYNVIVEGEEKPSYGKILESRNKTIYTDYHYVVENDQQEQQHHMKIFCEELRKLKGVQS